MCGPDDVQMVLPPGTKSYQLEISPSGHLVLPCSNFEGITSPNSAPSREVALHAIEGETPAENFQL